MSELRYARDCFADCQTAIEELCIGCPDENGWALLDNAKDPCCQHMVDDVTECDNPIVMEFQGKPFCAVRYEKHVKAELELYEKRMRGDWT
ncbi:MAG: hypothetical protein IJ111_01430 [Eggerthellaceae bacterium]|nr:hypothetical protein [Eggerthellaceae bacterium]